eukprot:CAMPEP_0167788848 /NCGR_PEP_ID=MMETSP0111_2-20121227/10296_1 /TAXON_ID=91324 /ORGANISM="Lotharella globosa, Strain CCCM811" /LENGTH=245 /DNA_ID=CAMNT_0007680827 /DNA_START=114 /DNA_END=851 /DNA_ORIENTATION=-
MGAIGLILIAKLGMESAMWIWDPPFKWSCPLLFNYLHIITCLLLGVCIPGGLSSLAMCLAPGLGSIVPVSLVVCTALSIVTIAALFTWSWYVGGDHGEIQEILEPSLPDISSILVFGFINALVEEFEYRGVIMCALLPYEEASGSMTFSQIAQPHIAAVCVMQGILFGLDHFTGGFPRGWWGLLMVSSWGLALGVLRCHSGGLLLPYMVHVIADWTVGYLIYSARRDCQDEDEDEDEDEVCGENE